ncbi:uncharacterized protein LOC119680860 [Teleopsis dalmanni]|uniref:uncharacterized protein LOC119680860 n=1 Tax=Teleopsis dalmanni TaxID=139649 RepID=UPI0018CF0A52|nr:uncharacterized protein LOC119680860 [Teleopsis dalmanni]
MVEMRNLKICSIFLCITTILKSNLAALLEPMKPFIACPELFRYVTEGNDSYGIVTIPRYLVTGSNLFLNVEICQRDRSQHDGFSLLPVEGFQKAMQNIYDKKPIEYRFTFPSQLEYPKLTKIAVNGHTICSDDTYPPPMVIFSADYKIYLPLRTAQTPESSTTPYISTTQNVNNCSNYFRYEQKDNQTIGLFKIPNYLFKTGIPEVSVKFTQNKTISNSKFGLVDYSNVDDSLLNVLEGKPVLFRYNFPDQTEIPLLKEIQVNGNTICITNNPHAGKMTFTSVRTIQLPVGFHNWNINTDDGDDDEHDEMENNRTCGQEVGVLTPYIHFGTEVNKGQFPWLASIFQKTDKKLMFICGGSLISARTVITAAHCYKLRELTADRSWVKLGGSNKENSQGMIGFGVEKVSIHPDFRKSKIPDADLALLVLTSSVTFTDYISPICLWNEASDINKIINKIGYIAGWGSTENSSISTTRPRVAYARIVSEIECLHSSDGFEAVTSSRTLCAGNRDLSGPCVGDSGSGLMIRKNKHWLLRGIVSIGQTLDGQCNLNEFVVYCDLAKHLEWVKSQMVN